MANYIHGILSVLPELAPEHEYFLYSNRTISLQGLPSMDSYHQRIDDRFGWCPGALWLLMRGAGLIKTDRLHVYWASSPLLPSGLLPGVVKIITVYDLVWLRCPETTTTYNLFVQRMCARNAIADADLIVVISRSTQDELVEALDVPRDRIKLVYPIVSEIYKPHERQKAADYISKKYGAPQRYLATVGTVEPRKNLSLLVEVLRILKSEGHLHCPLLIVGAKGWKNSRLFREIQAAGLTEEEIRFLGYMPLEDMPFFYSGAQIFLFPTLYEGFGLPPVEAMACGTPVIASSAQCMPEVLGDAAILEPPTSARRFAAAITSLLGDEDLRTAMGAKGIRRAQRFGSQTSTQQLSEVLEGQYYRS
jgi:glycosyltransferase involved in cell wall biosynthesis